MSAKDDLAELLHARKFPHGGRKDGFVWIDANAAHAIAELLTSHGYANVAMVRALHYSKSLPCTLPKDQTCTGCGHPWPCPTTRALEGA